MIITWAEVELTWAARGTIIRKLKRINQYYSAPTDWGWNEVESSGGGGGSAAPADANK